MQKFLRTILGRIQKPKKIQTAPLDGEIITHAESQPELSPNQFKFGVGYATGMVRDHNEDSVFSFASVLASHQGDVRFGLFIVADGMGGHSNGEVASNTAVKTFSSFVITKITNRLLDNNEDSGAIISLQEIMEGALQEAQKKVVSKATGGGTTLTAALVLGDQLTIAHVGDSRAYSLTPGGQISVLTKDHSLVQRMVELGDITDEEARVHPNRNVLLRAVGQMESFRPDLYSFPIQISSRLLVCSDGLWGVISDDQLQRICNMEADPVLGCQKLVEAANLAGGPDNISVILVQF